VSRLHEPDGKAAIGVALSSLLLLASAAWLPWATIQTGNLTTSFGGARFGWMLIACGVGGIGLTAISFVRRRSQLVWLQLSLGGIASVCSILLAFARIACESRSRFRFGLLTHRLRYRNWVGDSGFCRHVRLWLCPTSLGPRLRGK
jgi:hypothetical protein